jgi:hypothetical protein
MNMANANYRPEGICHVKISMDIAFMYLVNSTNTQNPTTPLSSLYMPASMENQQYIPTSLTRNDVKLNNFHSWCQQLGADTHLCKLTLTKNMWQSQIPQQVIMAHSSHHL